MPAKRFDPVKNAAVVSVIAACVSVFGAVPAFRGTGRGAGGFLLAIFLMTLCMAIINVSRWASQRRRRNLKPDDLKPVSQKQNPWQFNLSALLLIVTMTCIWWAVVSNSVQRQQRAVQTIQQFKGSVTYSLQVKLPAWLKNLLPQDYVSNVTEVRLNKSDIDDDGLAIVATLPELRSLNLEGTKITDKSLAHLSGLTRLAFLNLNGTGCSSEGLNYLKNMNQLDTLRLAFTNVSDDGLVVLRNMPLLTSLRLSGTQIGDAGLSEVTRLNRLLVLDICQTRVTPAGLAQLQKLPYLNILIVSREHVGPEGIRLSQRLPNLKSLNFGQTDDSQATAAEIKQAMPGIIGHGVRRGTGKYEYLWDSAPVRSANPRAQPAKPGFPDSPGS